MERVYLHWVKGNPKSESTLNAALERICKRNSLPKISMHDLRHTYATVLKENEISLKAISSCMGHHGTEITENVYINIPEETVTVHDCEKEVTAFAADILPKKPQLLDIQILKKDMLELLPPKAYNMIS